METLKNNYQKKDTKVISNVYKIDNLAINYKKIQKEILQRREAEMVSNYNRF